MLLKYLYLKLNRKFLLARRMTVLDTRKIIIFILWLRAFFPFWRFHGDSVKTNTKINVLHF